MSVGTTLVEFEMFMDQEDIQYFRLGLYVLFAFTLRRLLILFRTLANDSLRRADSRLRKHPKCAIVPRQPPQSPKGVVELDTQNTVGFFGVITVEQVVCV